MADIFQNISNLIGGTHISEPTSQDSFFTQYPQTVLLLLIPLCFFVLKRGSKDAQAHMDPLVVHNPDSNVLSKDVILLFGSQTGTSEIYARRLGRMMADQLSIETQVLSMEDVTLDNIEELAVRKSPFGRPAVLVLLTSTYGDGEPPDNAVALYDSLKNSVADGSHDSCAGLLFAVFGLGNSSYEMYNKVANDMDTYLQRLGGRRICDLGLGDDNTGTNDESYQDWNERLVLATQNELGLQISGNTVSTFSWNLEELPSAQDGGFKVQERLYLGERNDAQLENQGLTVAPYTAANPYYAPVNTVRQIFDSSCGRHCLHVELDIKGSGLDYETGDHVALWSINPTTEVDRFLRMLDLTAKRDSIFRLTPVSGSADPSSFPTPTTYATAVTHHLDICGPVPRSLLNSLAIYAPTPSIKERMLHLAEDKDEFHTQVHSKMLNLGQVLEYLSEGVGWSALPFTFIIENIPTLRARSYSISSSPTRSPGQIHITAAIKEEIFSETQSFRGLTSQYLMAVAGLGFASYPAESHELHLARSRHNDARVAIMPLKSRFRLPTNPLTPIVMIGPGTGVAPFRAFMGDKEHQAKQGKIGKCMLFTGCRRRDEDFIYAADWRAYEETLGSAFALYAAFSRETGGKVYVQHRMQEQSEAICDLLISSAGQLYICGDVKMASDVVATLAGIFAQQQKVSVESAQKIIRDMKLSGRLQEDVW